MIEKKYNFGEKTKEKAKQQDNTWKDLDVWQSPKYTKSKQKAIELIVKGKYELEEGDFWILMNQGGDKMVYTGLIISHNGCLKINDKLEDSLKFKPLSVSFVRDVGEKEKTMAYINQEQGIYEFGEISTKNCKNDYPYAMVLKRLMDRVILKNSAIGFFGIYSEAESDDFKDKPEPKEEAPKKNNFGLDPNGALANGDDMRETMDAKNKEQFIKIKENLESCGSVEELSAVWEASKPIVASLKKYAPVLYDKLIGCKDYLKNELDPEGIDDSAKLNEIAQ